MIYVSVSTIPPRIRNIKKSIDSLQNQTQKPDKIFLNIPYKYRRFENVVSDKDIPTFESKNVEITRCDDCGPGTKLLGSLKKLKKNSTLILADDDQVYEDYMIEKLYYFSSLYPNNAYSFYVHPIGDIGVGQGADGFAINTNSLDGIEIFYEKVVKDYKELFLYDDLWISFFLIHFKKNKVFSLRNYLKKNASGNPTLIYKSHSSQSGLISTYATNLKEAVKKRDDIAKKSLLFMQEKSKGLKI